LIDEEVLQIYLEESKDQLEQAEIDILEFSKNESSELINSIFRSIHSLKGGSMMMGKNNIGKLSHALENIFGKIRSNEIKIDHIIIDVSLKAIDKLKEMVQYIEKEDSFDNESLIEEIEKLKKSKTNQDKIVDKVTPLVKPKDELKKEDQLQETNNNLEIQKYLSVSELDLKNVEEDAKNQNKYLSFVYINLLNQSIKTIREFNDVMEEISDLIVKKNVVEKKIPRINREEDIFPYAMILISDKDPRDIFKKYNIIIEKIFILVEPKINDPSTYSSKDSKEKSESIKTESKSKPDIEATDVQLKVNLGIIDELIGLASEAVIVRNQILQSGEWDDDSEQGIRMTRLSQIITSFQTRVMKTRLLKLQSIYPRISRSVRDISRQLEKEVDFFFDGGDVEMDRLVVDAIIESLTHIIRNSIDHGIETPEEREINGKPRIGVLRLSASLRSGNVQIQIKDDGRGLNYNKIKSIAVSKGLITKEQAQEMKNEEARNIIFYPGFSTKTEVSEISGRGVGMDVVDRSFKKLGGKITLESEEGKGITITATIPQTVTVVFALILLCEGKRYSIFQKYVLEIFIFEKDNLININGNIIYRLREKLIPVIDLSNVLYPAKSKQHESDHMAVIQWEGRIFGLIFDQMVGIEEIVIKPLGEHFFDLDIYTGATVLGDGAAVLILDPGGIVNSTGLDYDIKQIESKQISISQNTLDSYILFEASNQLLLCSTLNIMRVEKLDSKSIKFIGDEKKYIFETNLISALDFSRKFGNDDPNTEDYIILVNYNNQPVGILIHSVVDILTEITLLNTDEIYDKELILGHVLIDNDVAIYFDLIHFITRFKDQRKGTLV
jgi:two-component system, chemotaxis family, sensor kinase CheA